MLRAKEQMEAQLREIADKIRVENPLDTFEPHEGEEGRHDIHDLYEARLHRLLVEAVFHGPDRELANFLLEQVATVVRQGRQ
jgi:hypothetical protein